METVGEPPLTLEGLITLDQDVEPYVLQWPAEKEEDGNMDVLW